MSPGRRRWSLGSLLLLLAGGNLALRVQIHQDSVNGTEGQSVLLPVSYTVDGASCFPLSIRWTFRNSPSAIIVCTVQNCSVDAWGAHSNCSAACYNPSPNRGRAELFPDNGSLLLRDLKLSDSGVYSVILQSTPTGSITLAVHQQRSSSEQPGSSNGQDPNISYWTIGVPSSVALLLLLLLFGCLWHWAQQKKRRTMEQQQVSGMEEPRMASTMACAVGDMATIYTRIGDSLEQPQPRPTAEPVYTSISPPEPPGQDTTLYHVVV